MKRKPPFVVLSLLTVTLLLLLAACGATDTPSDSAPDTTAFVWPADWTTSHPREVSYGGELRLSSTGGVGTFNPITSSESNSVRNMFMLSGASLMKLPPDSDAWIPYAAESVNVSRDGTVMDVVLREGLKWSDGTDITVEDYYFRWKAETDPDVGSNGYDSWFIEGDIIEMQITGERSMRFTFPKPDRTAFPVVGSHFPAPDHILGEIYRQGGAEALRAAWGVDVEVKQTVWSSPFVPVEFDVDEQRIVLERNEFFGEWNVDAVGNPLPYLDRITFNFSDEGKSPLELYLDGEIDIYSPADIDQVRVIARSTLDAVVLENISPIASSQFIVFNWNLASDPWKQDLFRNADFRKAMSHLVDREAIVDQVYAGAAEPMWSNVYQVLDYWVDPDVPKFPYDREAALGLLEGIGFTEMNENGFLVDEEGRELSFRLVTNAGSTAREKIVELFADAARSVGVRVETDFVDFSGMVSDLTEESDDRQFDAILIGLTGGSRDWPFGVNVIPCGTNLHMWNQDPSGECLDPQEEKASDLYFKGRQTLDTEQAREIGYQIQRVLAQIQPVIYTVSPTVHVSWRDHVKGEFPHDIISDLVGSREYELTWIQK